MHPDHGARVATTYLIDGNRFETWGNRYRALPLEIWYPSTGIGGTPNTMAKRKNMVHGLSLS